MATTHRAAGATPALRSLAAAFGNTPPALRPLKVLLPFDGSAAALNALRYVGRNLAGLDARVLLANVQRVYIDAEMLHAAHSLAQLHRVEGEAILRSAGELLELAGVEYEAEVAFGHPMRAIARLAEERGCDLIVMGTRGRAGLLGALRPSMADRVADRASVAVMRIPLPAGGEPPGPLWQNTPYIAA
jgi:nucleotide-binding universal stress UspA family protein